MEEITVKKVVFKEIVIYFVVAIFICLSSVISIGIYSKYNFDDLTNNESLNSLKTALAYEQENLNYINTMNSVWTQAYENIVLKPDVKWITDNIGLDLSKSFHLELVLIANDNNQIEYGFSDGKLLEGKEKEIYTQPFLSIIKEQIARKKNLKNMRIAVKIDKKVFIASVGEILPSYDQSSNLIPGKERKYLILAHELNNAFIRSLKKFATIETLTFIPDAEFDISSYNLNAIDIFDQDNKILGYLIWEPVDHSKRILSQIIPILGLAFFVLVILSFVTLYSILRAGHSYDKLVTSLKDLTDDLTEAKVLAEKSSSDKSRFLATMSHEIRTPMNGIIGMLNLLQETTLTREQTAYVNTVDQSSKALMQLVDDILEFSQSETKEQKPFLKPANIRNIVYEIQGLMQPVALQKNILFESFFSQTVPLMVETDPVRLRQILLHLTSNAFKVTTEGKVRINVTDSSSTKDSVELRFQVIDTGGGMTAAVKEAVLKDMFAANGMNTGPLSGQGLSLGIAKNLVGLLGGKIGVDSKVGEGSTFWFTLSVKVL